MRQAPVQKETFQQYQILLQKERKKENKWAEMTNQEKIMRFGFFVKNLLFSVIPKNLTQVLSFHLHKPCFFLQVPFLAGRPLATVLSAHQRHSLCSGVIPNDTANVCIAQVMPTLKGTTLSRDLQTASESVLGYFSMRGLLCFPPVHQETKRNVGASGKQVLMHSLLPQVHQVCRAWFSVQVKVLGG